jgi:hypothetical protein
MSMPNTSPVAVDADSDNDRRRDDATGVALLHVGRVDPQEGPITLDRSVEEGFDLPSISSHRRLTWLFDTPVPPIALTRSSAERVETPWT